MRLDIDHTITSASLEIVTGNEPASVYSTPESFMPPVEEYSLLLKEHGVKYKRIDSFILIGEIEWVQGWILDLSCIISQVHDLLQVVVPFLIRDSIPFKIVQNSKTATAVLTGEQGYINLGKVLSVFPADEHQTIKTAEELIRLTINFKGPQILTDRRLGGLVYTRYGAGNPVVQINERGAPDNYIYNPEGNLIKDPFSIPFSLPKGIEWPFSNIAPVTASKKKSVLQDKYKPIFLLKEDAKGYVKKGLLLTKFWQIKWCVIKEGKQYMGSDLWGRDISDRLRWQFDLHRDLENTFPIPKIYDLFEENGDHYLVMAYVKGKSLEKNIYNIFNGRTWRQLAVPDRLRILDYIQQLFDIIKRMHEKGYIHRDITPANFLVKKSVLWAIDLELAYNESVQKPTPPFRLGTPGFMSPEQAATMLPKKEQDIYAMGGNLIFLLTGLMPDNFSLEYAPALKEQLSFFIPSHTLIHLISKCFHLNPRSRPSLSTLNKAIAHFREEQEQPKKMPLENINRSLPAKKDTAEIIVRGIRGLADPALISEEGLWLSRTVEEEGLAYYQTQSLSVYEDFHQGLSGVLYLLARAHKMGYAIDACQYGYEQSIAQIKKSCLRQLDELPGGLYSGTAGIALSLAEGMCAGLIEDTADNREEIRVYLKNKNLEGSGLVKGMAGQGIALLKAASVFDKNLLLPLLQQTINILLETQEKDGSWISLTDKNKKALKLTGWGHGVAGVLCFLFEYCRYNAHDNAAKQAASRAAEWLARQAIIKQDQVRWCVNNKTNLSSGSFQDGTIGIALSMIKAYEILGEPQYRKLAEIALRNYSKDSISNNLTLSSGLVGLGEVYLEAEKAFKTEEWQSRADWIENFITHYYHQEKEGSCYWFAGESPMPVAGFLGGCGGIIHFLLRCTRSCSLTHPLLAF